MREALFNLLTARMELAGATVLDLYAGSGALGLEAMSRGAASVVFVESDHRAAAIIAKNIATLGVRDAEVRRTSVASVLTAGADGPVDLVLADPPYRVTNDEMHALLATLVDRGWTAPGTVVAVERGTGHDPLRWPAGWTVWPPRRYGDTRLELARAEPDRPR
ncbi:putative methyltransferase [Mycolicibacterium thermoresistibile ATCC 19527]|uniref:Methyltransferase n=2 Tax=Mycolicibacterium thermoresistibile TaxID=1797 RepID=A0A124E8R5_MYCTH|nr:putative methyltransferase [Mycolicibacterium thermoresistibile ATCC 19527]GAT16541.1 methyltransferase [Mycolicibacterium thermoresistibile]SNW17770.1 RNA methyltransferase, RsmD family [Mycolicibacterium thermoresistibile]